MTTQPNDQPPAPVRTLLDAVNRGDTEAFLASFTPDGVVDDWGREFRGADAIRSWSDGELIGVRASLDVTGVEERAGAVVITAQVGGDGFNGPSHFTFELDGEQVSRMTIRA
jgi:ketosteroid isomerase-like protein